MNKTSVIFTIIGIAVLALIGFLIMRTPEQQDVAADAKTAETNPNEFVFDYKKDLPYETQQIQVKEGDNVVINVTSDVAAEVHLHGYDIEKELEAGETATFDFVADKTGRFPLELHVEPVLTLGFIEVYPK